MHHRRNHEVRPDALRQRVREFPRDELLRGIARVAAEQTNWENTQEDERDYKLKAIREGILFQLAGLCVTHANNHRSKTVDDAVVEDLLNGLYNVWPPELDGESSEDGWQRLLSRIAYQQMPYQVSSLEQLARSLCLFGDDNGFGEPVFERGRWERILGVPLEEFLRISLIMYGAAASSPGGISRRTLLAENVRPVFEPFGVDRSLQVVDQWLARPVDDLAQMGRQKNIDPDDLWRFNPFYEWPIAILADETYVTPSPMGVLQRLGPQGLYFVARDAAGADEDPKAFQAFTNALGTRFESYVGEQLRCISHADIRPEVDFGNGQKSVDFFIETSELLVLVEVKSAAPNIATRSGIFPQHGDIQRNIQRACEQITNSADLIKQGHPDFPALRNRPIRGLVITREQYFNLSMPFIASIPEPASIPTTVVSSFQLEATIPALSNDPNCGTSLLGALGSDPGALKTSLTPLPLGRNRLLAEIGSQWLKEHRLIPPNGSTER